MMSAMLSLELERDAATPIHAQPQGRQGSSDPKVKVEPVEPKKELGISGKNDKGGKPAAKRQGKASGSKGQAGSGSGGKDKEASRWKLASLLCNMIVLLTSGRRPRPGLEARKKTTRQSNRPGLLYHTLWS